MRFEPPPWSETFLVNIGSRLLRGLCLALAPSGGHAGSLSAAPSNLDESIRQTPCDGGRQEKGHRIETRGNDEVGFVPTAVSNLFSE